MPLLGPAGGKIAPSRLLGVSACNSKPDRLVAVKRREVYFAEVVILGSMSSLT